MVIRLGDPFTGAFMVHCEAYLYLSRRNIYYFRAIKLGTNNLKPGIVKEASAKGVQVRQQNADEFAARVKPVIEAMREQGKSLLAVAKELDHLGVKTARGCKWTATSVKNAMARN
jgi:hypothetical protein